MAIPKAEALCYGHSRWIDTTCKSMHSESQHMNTAHMPHSLHSIPFMEVTPPSHCCELSIVTVSGQTEGPHRALHTGLEIPTGGSCLLSQRFHTYTTGICHLCQDARRPSCSLLAEGAFLFLIRFTHTAQDGMYAFNA